MAQDVVDSAHKKPGPAFRGLANWAGCSKGDEEAQEEELQLPLEGHTRYTLTPPKDTTAVFISIYN